jgi:hypothetical protein
VMAVYPAELGLSHGAGICAEVTRQLIPAVA